jgi:molybdopterin/thiamine biosynthesis adenylyltransferase
MNEQCVRQGKPMVDAAMYELSGQLTTIQPGRTACLACRVPERPPDWKREFPVFGAVAGAVGCLAATEAIKLITGIGEPLADRLLTFDLRDVRFRTVRLARRAGCAVCGGK